MASRKQPVSKTTNNSARAIPRGKKVNTLLNILGSILFIVYAYYALAIRRGDMLFRGQELSLFVFDKAYWMEMMREPAGFLEYAGNFLTQFFYYPWLGALIFVLLLCVLQGLTYKAFRMSKSLFLLSWVPSACMLLYVTQVDYSLFAMKSDNIFYLHLLGVMAALIPLLISPERIRDKCRLVFFYLVLGYPLFGFYALLGILLMIISEVASLLFKRQKGTVYLVFGLVFTALVPLIYQGLYQGTAIRFIYIYGLPFMNYLDAGIMWLPLILCYGLLALFAVLFSMPLTIKSNAFRMPTNILIVPVCIFVVALFSNRDVNFDTQMSMERAIANDDWNKVLTIAKEKNPNPNRLLILYRNMALWKNSEICEKMFCYPNTSEKLHTKNKMASQTVVAGSTIPFYYGLLNYSYRWNMENMVMYGACVQGYKYMLRYAVLKEENRLAEKYAGRLSNTLFYADWAKAQMHYVEQPQDMKNNPVYADILPLLRYDNHLGMEEKIMERTILKHFRSLQSGSDEILDLVMASVLTAKDVSMFWPIFFVYVQKDRPIPTHVQEAALLLAFFEKRDLSPFYPKMNDSIVKRFNEYMRTVNLNKNLTEAQLGEVLRPIYQKTYWYYFNFVSELKAN